MQSVKSNRAGSDSVPADAPRSQQLGQEWERGVSPSHHTRATASVEESVPRRLCFGEPPTICPPERKGTPPWPPPSRLP